MNKLRMAADKLKKLEARGRAAFLQGDINAATRYFTQALEKYSSPDRCKIPEPKHKRLTLKSRTRSILSMNNDEDQVWILQAGMKETGHKKTEKNSRKKEEKKIPSSLEILTGIISDADTGIKTFPSYPMNYLRKASALILLNQWEEARKTYTTGLAQCSEKSILTSALVNLNRTYKITTCAANLDMKQLTDLVNENGPTRPIVLPTTSSTIRRNKFRLQSQRRLTKKLFPKEETDTIVPQIETKYCRRRNSSSTDTHL